MCFVRSRWRCALRDMPREYSRPRAASLPALRPLALSATLCESQGALCPFCLTGREIPHLDGLRAASLYDGAVRQAILALKFRGQRRVASPLADLLAACCRHETLSADLIVPIPLHANRRRERGYDQARLLAQPLGRLLQRPVRTDLLVRTRATRAQMTLSASERHTNVAGAFVLTSPAVRAALSGKRILLLDDVTTTGSTLDAAAAALREANPAAIWGLAVARPELHAEGQVESRSRASREPRRVRSTQR